MIIVITGKPGSGKGTQAKLLAEKFNLHYLSTGDISREWAKEDPKIDEIVNQKGQWIPEEAMTARVSKILTENFAEPDDILFEGYPRFLSQYQFLENWLGERGAKIDKVILLDVSDEEVVRRLSARRLDPKTGKVYNLLTQPPGPEINQNGLVQRHDDQPEVIKSRINEFNVHTQPMIDYVEKEGKLVRVDGARPIDAIQADLAALLKGLPA